ncbi:TPA: hypothetical protein N0F65_000413 [Lagenidium giganteum]|uniref:Uncharacterized protein n=1 Tax=Lagenidium giganteum TaxID=4803 RepID=A0AAV2Z2Z6_9STRA|nr:TPA: hypothetical protein N0F65_000413 [Lagenidium giganteum]
MGIAERGAPSSDVVREMVQAVDRPSKAALSWCADLMAFGSVDEDQLQIGPYRQHRYTLLQRFWLRKKPRTLAWGAPFLCVLGYLAILAIGAMSFWQNDLASADVQLRMHAHAA